MTRLELLKKGELRITQAKTQLLIRFMFFGLVATRLKFRNAREDGMEFIDTMATDGAHVWWNEDFVESITQEEVIGVLIHEMLHVILLHFARRGNRIPLIWNIACDFQINQTVLKAGAKLPANGLFNPKYENWLVDRVYDDLIQQAEELKKQFGGRLPWGMVLDPRNDNGSPMSDSEAKELEEDIKISVLSAAETAKAVGKLPGSLQFIIKACQEPVIDYHEYIQHWVKGSVPDDYSWRRPNKRIMGIYGAYAPSFDMRGCGNGVLSIDNSGSVSDKELRKYVTNIVGIIEQLKPDRLTIIQHDSRIQKIDEWESGMEFNELAIKGRGGTNIRPVFDLVKKMDEPIDWQICFTDMEIHDFPKAHEAPDWPVLWAATGKDVAPFGTYINLLHPMDRHHG